MNINATLLGQFIALLMVIVGVIAWRQAAAVRIGARPADGGAEGMSALGVSSSRRVRRVRCRWRRIR